LVGLPNELTISLLTNWIGIKDVVAVDSAYCVRDLRTQLHSIFASHAFVVSVPSIPAISDPVLHWFYVKCIRVDSLVVLRNVSSSCIQYCEKFGDFVRNLTLQNKEREYTSVVGCAQLIQSCTNLCSVVMVACYVDAATLEAIWELSNLRILKFQNCHDNNGPSSDDDLYSPFTKPKQPLRLSMLVLNGTSPCVSLALLRACSPVHLHRLDINATASDDVPRIASILRQCVNLVELCLEDVADHALMELLQCCPQVQHLELFNCLDLTDESAAPIAQTLTLLKSLNVTFTEFTDVLLDELALHCADTLETLNILNCFGVQGNGLDTLLQACQKLTTLHISMFEGLVFDTVHLGRLTFLSVSLEDIEAAYFVQNVLPNCRSLQHLQIQAFDMDTDDFIPHTELFPSTLRALDLISVVSFLREDDRQNVSQELQEAFPSVAVTLKQIVD